MDEVPCLGFSNLFNLFTSSQAQDQALLCILVRLVSSTSHTCPAFPILCVPTYPFNMHAFVHFLNSFFFFNSYLFSSVQSLSHVWLFVTPWTIERQASLSITSSGSLLKLMSIESVMPSSHLILCHPLLLLNSIFPSIRVFSKESSSHQVAKLGCFRFSISPSSEYLGLISFRMDWLNLLAVQGTHKSLLQHHNSKASILQCSALFTVQLSHAYMTTGKP